MPKINIMKWARIIGHIIAAAPVVIAAARPIRDELKKDKPAG
jgi:hypothetical protein